VQKAREYDLIISNTHQQKGNEFSVVIMSNDFAKSRNDESFISPRMLQDRFNLIYVAMTRACDVLVLNRDLDYLAFQHTSLPVAALRLPSTVGAECCVCGDPVETVAETGGGGGGGGAGSQNNWAASTRRWGLNISVSKDRYARGHVSANSSASNSEPPTACCSKCLPEALQGLSRPSWAPPGISPVGLAKFWGPQVLPPPS